jgi:hypothetical protein
LFSDSINKTHKPIQVIPTIICNIDVLFSLEGVGRRFLRNVGSYLSTCKVCLNRSSEFLTYICMFTKKRLQRCPSIGNGFEIRSQGNKYAKITKNAW